MPEQGRVSDNSHCGSDAHGCPACPHPVTGPGVAGSPDVFVNALPALRVGDPGIHAACCGPNTWKAKDGASSVFINGKAAHRKDDAVTHCGGTGKLIVGSPDVFVEDHDPPKAKDPLLGTISFTVVTRAGDPVPNLNLTAALPDGSEVSGTTDSQGKFKVEQVPVGMATIRFAHKFAITNVKIV